MLTGTVLARLPLFAFAAVQAALLPGLAALLARGDRGGFVRGMTRLLAAAAVVTVAATVVAATVGEDLLHLFFGDRYDLGNHVLMQLALASGIYIGAVIAGQSLLALRRYRAAAAGWAVGATAFMRRGRRRRRPGRSGGRRFPAGDGRGCGRLGSGSGAARPEHALTTSAIVLAFGVEPWLDDCLTAVAAQADEVVIVDNGSTHPDVISAWESRAGVVVVRPETNLGYAGGCNAAAAAATGDMFVFVNSDAIVQPGALTH